MKIYKNYNAGCSTKYNGNDILIFIYLGTTLTEYMKITMLFCFFCFLYGFYFCRASNYSESIGFHRFKTSR